MSVSLSLFLSHSISMYTLISSYLKAKLYSGSMIDIAEQISKAYLAEGSSGSKPLERIRPINIVRDLGPDRGILYCFILSHFYFKLKLNINAVNKI